MRLKTPWRSPVCPWGKCRRGFCSTPWNTPQRRSTGTWRQVLEGSHLERDSLSAHHTPPAGDWTRPCRDSGPPQRPSCETRRTSLACTSAVGMDLRGKRAEIKATLSNMNMFQTDVVSTCTDARLIAEIMHERSRIDANGNLGLN